AREAGARELLPLKSITLSYNVHEDRILATINVGHAETWSCWLTRRLVLALLERAGKFLSSTSGFSQRTSSEFRDELATFERDAALSKTAKAMRTTPAEELKTSTSAAVLAERITITQRGDGLHMEIAGRDGGSAGVLARAEFERILQMLKIEIGKAGWTSP